MPRSCAYGHALNFVHVLRPYCSQVHINFRSKTKFTYLSKSSLFSVGLYSFLVDSLYEDLSRHYQRVFPGKSIKRKITQKTNHLKCRSPSIADISHSLHIQTFIALAHKIRSKPTRCCPNTFFCKTSRRFTLYLSNFVYRPSCLRGRQQWRDIPEKAHGTTSFFIFLSPET